MGGTGKGSFVLVAGLGSSEGRGLDSSRLKPSEGRISDFNDSLG